MQQMCICIHELPNVVHLVICIHELPNVVHLVICIRELPNIVHLVICDDVQEVYIPKGIHLKHFH